MQANVEPFFHKQQIDSREFYNNNNNNNNNKSIPL
jgi:hypothetical protein